MYYTTILGHSCKNKTAKQNKTTEKEKNTKNNSFTASRSKKVIAFCNEGVETEIQCLFKTKLKIIFSMSDATV